LKNILKNFNVDFEIDINLKLLVKNFEYFYEKYIEPKYQYSPRSFKRKRASEDSETKENKRIKLQKYILQQQEYKKTNNDINDISHLVRKRKNDENSNVKKKIKQS